MVERRCLRRLCQKCAKCGRPMLALVVWACDGLVVEGLGWPRTGRGSRQAGVIPERVRGKVVAHTSPHHNRTQPPSIKSHTTTHKIAHHHQPTAHHPFFFPTRTRCERQRARTAAATEVTTTPPQDDRARESEWGEPSRGPVCRGASSSCAVVGCRRAGSTPHVYHTTVRVG